MKNRSLIALAIAAAFTTGAAFAQTVYPGQPSFGSFTCKNCHNDSPTLCIEMQCEAPSNACVENEGEYEDGTLWVSVSCGFRV